MSNIENKNSRKEYYTINSFSFIDKSKEDMVDYLNEEHPITSKGNSDLIERVHARYPLISKTDIVDICNNTFGAIRDLLVLGKILNFNGLFYQTKFSFTKGKNPKQKEIMRFKVAISTPPGLK